MCHHAQWDFLLKVLPPSVSCYCNEICWLGRAGVFIIQLSSPGQSPSLRTSQAGTWSSWSYPKSRTRSEPSPPWCSSPSPVYFVGSVQELVLPTTSTNIIRTSSTDASTGRPRQSIPETCFPEDSTGQPRQSITDIPFLSDSTGQPQTVHNWNNLPRLFYRST